MSGISKTIRDLQRSYRRERAEILADESLSWEKRMRRIKELFAEYARRRGELEKEAG